jgi:Flp pilus assembly protein TadG
MTTLRLAPAHGAERSRRVQSGQALALFVVILFALAAMAGLLIDGGTAWVNRREAQNAADLAVLAAGKAVTDAQATCNASGLAVARAAAIESAEINGFSSVTVEYPSGGEQSGCDDIRVSVTRPVSTTFSRLLGQNNWTAGATAVARIVRLAAIGSPRCSFCSLNATNENHTLLVQLGSTLIVDGEIYVNSSNGNKSGDPNSAIKLKDWYVGGDGFDIFGAGGRIEADYINVVGGWETHDNGIAVARNAKCPASHRPDPIAYSAMNPPLVSNVCVHQPVLPDPLQSFPAPKVGDLPIRATGTTKFGNGAHVTLEPGVYRGGIEASGTAIVNLNPGVYYMSDGKFVVKDKADVVGNGVMIYSGPKIGSTTGGKSIEITTTGRVVLSPPTTGVYAGMTMFLDRSSDDTITLQPNNSAQCNSTAAAGEPQGCIGGISGTVYAAHPKATVIVKAAGTANLQIVSGKILIQNGSTARFTYKSGFATENSYYYELVE